MNLWNKISNNKKIKKIFTRLFWVAIIGWFVFRFVMVAMESKMVVFNPIRDEKANGTPVGTVTVYRQTGTINFPIAIRNNRAYVSGAARSKLKPGYKIADGGTVAFVSGDLDLDSGMYVVQTNGATDGLNNVVVPCNGYFIPVYAIRHGMVMVADADVARAKNVNVIAQDYDMACVSGEIADGDIVILSKVSDNQKVNVQK